MNGCHVMIRGLSGRFAVFASKGGVVVVGADLRVDACDHVEFSAVGRRESRSRFPMSAADRA